MRSEATRDGETSVGGQVLYMALELSERTWKVLFASPAGRRRERNVAARDVAPLLEEIAAAGAVGASARGELLRGGPGRVLARPGAAGQRHRQPGGGLLFDRGGAAGAAGQDGPRGPGQVDGAAAALGGGREEGVERGAGARCGSGGHPPAVAVDRAAEGGARPACHAHQGAAGDAGPQAGADRGTRLGQACG